VSPSAPARVEQAPVPQLKPAPPHAPPKTATTTPKVATATPSPKAALLQKHLQEITVPKDVVPVLPAEKTSKSQPKPATPRWPNHEWNKRHPRRKPNLYHRSPRLHGILPKPSKRPRRPWPNQPLRLSRSRLLRPRLRRPRRRRARRSGNCSILRRRRCLRRRSSPRRSRRCNLRPSRAPLKGWLQWFAPPPWSAARPRRGPIARCLKRRSIGSGTRIPIPLSGKYSRAPATLPPRCGLSFNQMGRSGTSPCTSRRGTTRMTARSRACCRISGVSLRFRTRCRGSRLWRSPASRILSSRTRKLPWPIVVNCPQFAGPLVRRRCSWRWRARCLRGDDRSGRGVHRRHPRGDPEDPDCGLQF